MSNTNAKNTKVMTADEMSDMMDKILNGQSEILAKQEAVSRQVGDFEQRVTRIEGANAKQPAAEALEEVLQEAQAAKAGVLGKFRQASTTKKVVIATVGTAAVAGAAYAGYKGFEMYQGRKEVQEQNILGVEAVGTAITPAKQDAIRQGLSITK